MAWTYSDWRGKATFTLQRAQLILHMQEVSDRLSGFQSTTTEGRSGSRFSDMRQYLADCQKELDRLNANLGLAPEQMTNAVLVELRPKLETPLY